MAQRPSSPGTLGGTAAQAIVQQEKIVQAMKNLRKTLNSRPAAGMELAAAAPAPAPAPNSRDPTGMGAKFIAEAASKKGGRRRNRKSRKTRKSRRSHH